MNNNKKLSFLGIVGVSIGATIGSGVFSFSGDMAAGGANSAAVIIGWGLAGLGTLFLMLTFFSLNKVKPKLTGGIQVYAQDGWGDYLGFSTTYGYWLSIVLMFCSYAVLLFAAIGQFIPLFGEGNNLPAIVAASIFYWGIALLLISGVKKAAFVNLVVTFAKIIPIIVFIIAVIILRYFKMDIFLENFLGDGKMGLFEQIKSTTVITVWSFIGIEGAVAVSGRAKKMSDVGKALITSFIFVFILYLIISVLSMGIMPREELAKLSQPALGQILEKVVGSWGATIINIGVIVALVGASLSASIIAISLPSTAAKKGNFLKVFAKENKNESPVNAILIQTTIIQIFLIVIYFSAGTYRAIYGLSAGMIMIPYLLSGFYHLKLVNNKETFAEYSKKGQRTQLFIAIMSSIYGMWMVYASGLVSILVTTLLYAPAIFLYVKNQKEHGKKVFASNNDKVIMALVLGGAMVSVILMVTGKINVF